jgi:predicted Rossmann fold nucleotide-binding protein DprA/Smf involved in DNA uptake
VTRPHYITPPIEESFPLFAVRRIDTPIAAARRSDPATSHAAAASAPVAEHQAVILDALASGPAGASGIAARCGLSSHQVNKRLTELARAGRIVETGRTVRSGSGRGEREWRVA